MSFAKGTKIKPDAKMHRHKLCVFLTEAEFEELCDIANQWDLPFSKAIRACVNTVSAMPEAEKIEKVRRALWQS